MTKRNARGLLAVGALLGAAVWLSRRVRAAPEDGGVVVPGSPQYSAPTVRIYKDFAAVGDWRLVDASVHISNPNAVQISPKVKCRYDMFVDGKVVWSGTRRWTDTLVKEKEVTLLPGEDEGLTSAAWYWGPPAFGNEPILPNPNPRVYWEIWFEDDAQGMSERVSFS